MTGPQEEKARIFDLRDREYLYRQEGDGYGVAGDMRWFDNASFPEGTRSEGIVLHPEMVLNPTPEQSHAGEVVPAKLDRELLHMPRPGDIFVIQPHGSDTPIALEIESFGQARDTWLPYFEARGKPRESLDQRELK